jgi:hypothetical protein
MRSHCIRVARKSGTEESQLLSVVCETLLQKRSLVGVRALRDPLRPSAMARLPEYKRQQGSSVTPQAWCFHTLQSISQQGRTQLYTSLSLSICVFLFPLQSFSAQSSVVWFRPCPFRATSTTSTFEDSKLSWATVMSKRFDTPKLVPSLTLLTIALWH